MLRTCAHEASPRDSGLSDLTVSGPLASSSEDVGEASEEVVRQIGGNPNEFSLQVKRQVDGVDDSSITTAIMRVVKLIVSRTKDTATICIAMDIILKSLGARMSIKN